MKLQVTRRRTDNNLGEPLDEVIVLTEPLLLTRLPSGSNILHCATGMDHFFNEDGTYDGWGMRIQGRGGRGVVDLETAGELIEAVEADREFIAPPTPPPLPPPPADSFPS